MKTTVNTMNLPCQKYRSERLLKTAVAVLAILFSLTAREVSAEVSMPAIFSDGMVLQQQSEVNVWGKGEPGVAIEVTASWTAKSFRTRTDADGNWHVKVETPSSGGPFEMSVRCGKEKKSFSDVLIGEVWLCSGQSNMEEPLKGYPSQGIEESLPAIMSSKDDGLRLFTVKKGRSALPVDTLIGKWEEAAPDAVAEFSATAYFFGRFLRDALKVPVGLICSSVGGTPVEAWTDRETLSAFPYVTLPPAEGRPKSSQSPTVLYNAMIHPLVGYGLRGCIWYQGESNYEHPERYIDLFSGMVASWRSRWGIGDFPFLYCQIAPYDYGIITKKGDPIINSAYLREAQMKAESVIPNSSMVVLMDAGLQAGIHPRKKRTAGERLAMRAMTYAYGVRANVESPRFASMQVEDSTAVLTFDRSPKYLECTLGQYPDGFEMAGEDRVFHPARAFVKWNTNQVYVTCPEVSRPVAVRYAFHNGSDATLFGQNGMPVSSFRTDTWPIEPDGVKE